MVTLARSTVLLDAAAAAGVPVLLVGSPGIGKSSMLRELAAARGLHSEVVTASVHEPSDFNGLPVLRDGRFEFEPPAWARRVYEAGHARVVFDEINTAAPATQKALLRVILEGVVGPLTMPPGVSFVAAMNPVEIATGGYALPPPLANRFLHLQVTTDPDAWIDGMLTGWSNTPKVTLAVTPTAAARARVLTEVAAFVAAHPASLDARPDDPALASGPWASGRTWDFVTRILPALPDEDEDARITAVEGLVGRATADAFFTWVLEQDLPDPMKVLADPSSFDWAGARGDRAISVLRGITGGVSLDRSLYPAALDILRRLLDADRDDVAAAGVKSLLALRPADVPVDRDLLRRFTPLLARAGKVA